MLGVLGVSRGLVFVDVSFGFWGFILFCMVHCLYISVI